MLCSTRSISDFGDYSFPSVSACPSLASSPVVARRDSILKHSGSVKNTDRRVSIKQNQPIVVEYLSEKRQPSSHAQQTTVCATTTNGSTSMSKSRPTSLILTKSDRPLIRTPSIDQDQDDDTTVINFTDSCGNPRTMQPSNVGHHFVPIDLNAKDDDDEDESAPLVQNLNNKESTKINSLNTHS